MTTETTNELAVLCHREDAGTAVVTIEPSRAAQRAQSRSEALTHREN